jgi:glycosyltransferase involved in cell wall biosynthesis
VSRPVVWVLVNDLGRTGVPVALARMARWSAGRGELDLRVVARTGGPLEADLIAAGGEVVALEPASGRSAASTVAVATAQLGRPTPGAAVRAAWWRRQVRHLPPPDIVLVHGAGALPLADALRPRFGDARTVVHLHELDAALGRSAAPGEVQLLASIHHVIAVTGSVRQMAVARGVPEARTSVVPGAVDDPPGGWSAPRPEPTASAELLSIGEAGWRKGTDHAIAAAYELRRHDPALRWHWVGARPGPGWEYAVGSPTPLVWHGPCPDPWEVVARPSLVVIPSREDPLPLVALEAGARGIAVVATATGGLPDLLADGRGSVVPTRDLDALVGAVRGVLDDPTAAAGSAARLRQHVHDHHRLDAVGPRWLAALTGT